MKKLYILILCFLPIVINAENIDALWQQAEKAYATRDYESAVAIYEKLVVDGESAPLYYNYANALLKAGYTGKAILFYERALRLDPSNDDIKYNLEFANLTKTDKIDKIETFFVAKWYEDITMLFRSNVWAYLSLSLFLLAMVCFLLFRFGKNIVLRKVGFGLFVVMFVCSVLSVFHAIKSYNMIENSRAAILMVGSETAKSTPDSGGTEVFVIHEGTKVFVKSTLGEWSEVRIEDGNIGWIRTSSYEII